MAKKKKVRSTQTDASSDHETGSTMRDDSTLAIASSPPNFGATAFKQSAQGEASLPSGQSGEPPLVHEVSQESANSTRPRHSAENITASSLLNVAESAAIGAEQEHGDSVVEERPSGRLQRENSQRRSELPAPVTSPSDSLQPKTAPVVPLSTPELRAERRHENGTEVKSVEFVQSDILHHHEAVSPESSNVFQTTEPVGYVRKDFHEDQGVNTSRTASTKEGTTHVLPIGPSAGTVDSTPAKSSDPGVSSIPELAHKPAISQPASDATPQPKTQTISEQWPTHLKARSEVRKPIESLDPSSSRVSSLHEESTKAVPPAVQALKSLSTAAPRTELRAPSGSQQITAESRPPAPSPPVGRVRPRHAPAFDTDDEDDLALIRPRVSGNASSRDSSREAPYPPPAQQRSIFASRVPPDNLVNAPTAPPPGYQQPRYYAPAAPPYYQGPNHAANQSNPYAMQHPYGPPPGAAAQYQEGWGHNQPQYATYHHTNSGQRHEPLSSRDYPRGMPALEGNAATDEEGDIFGRIAQAIPDLHVLLARYKETHGQLGVREELLRRADVEQQSKLRAKDQEIDELKHKLASAEGRQTSEASRLRFEMGNLEEQVKELRERLTGNAKMQVEHEQLKSTFDATQRSWEVKYEALEKAHAELRQTSTQAKNAFEEWKTSTTTRNDAEKMALAVQFDKKLTEADDKTASHLKELSASHVEEKERMQLDHERQIHVQRQEIDFLRQAHHDKVQSLQIDWEEQRGSLEAQHLQAKDESDKAWIDLHGEATRKADERQATIDQLLQEREELQRRFNVLQTDTRKEKEVMKSIAGNLEAEKTRLEQLMECYGDVAEIKSKGDTFYITAFSHLQGQVFDLATNHFAHLPVAPPPEILADVPSNLPPFLSETAAARQLRTAYVIHTVSKLVTYRVFGPFLFSLGRRYDKADSLFSIMSTQIREKSTRKEAIWRQQTLLAAFTSTGAKERINTAASTVVEEIVNAIKHFAAPKEEEAIKIAVRRIVKLAAETWRFARLEREMITATMPALLDDEHQFRGSEFWPAYRPEGTLLSSLVGMMPSSEQAPWLLLRLFPVIHREPKHIVLSSDREGPLDEGCVFHYGLALYEDAEPVVQRVEEVAAAGSPPISASPSIPADVQPLLLLTSDDFDIGSLPKNSAILRLLVDQLTTCDDIAAAPPRTPELFDVISTMNGEWEGERENEPAEAVRPHGIEHTKQKDSAPTGGTVKSQVSTQDVSIQSGASTEGAVQLCPQTPPASTPYSIKDITTDSSPLIFTADSLAMEPLASTYSNTRVMRSGPENVVTLSYAPSSKVLKSCYGSTPPQSIDDDLIPTSQSFHNTSRDSVDVAPPQTEIDVTQHTSKSLSPLLAALKEIECQSLQYSDIPTQVISLTSRRSSRFRHSKDKLSKLNDRSAISHHRLSSDTHGSKKSVTDGTSFEVAKTYRMERTSRSRYSCESRSAAIKGLYLSGALAEERARRTGPSRKDSTMRVREKDAAKRGEDRDAEEDGVTVGTWDTSSGTSTDASTDVEPEPELLK